jgi:hypothetical protein
VQEPFGRLELDVGVDRSVAGLRTLGAVAVLPASALLALVRPDGPGLILASLGALFGVGWIFAARRSRRRVGEAARHALVLTRDGLTLEQGEGAVDLAWREVTEVDVDEERLQVRVHRRGGDPLRIEPHFRGPTAEGLGVYALQERVDAAWAAARD